MPMVMIQSLPLGDGINMPVTLRSLCEHVAAAGHVELAHVSANWRYLTIGGHAVGGVSADLQPRDSHPVMAELMTPDFYPDARIEAMLTTIAEQISAHAGVTLTNVFVTHRAVHSGRVFDNGRIVYWPETQA